MESQVQAEGGGEGNNWEIAFAGCPSADHKFTFLYECLNLKPCEPQKSLFEVDSFEKLF